MTVETETGRTWNDVYKIDLLAPADRDDTRDEQFYRDVLSECKTYIRKGPSGERVQRVWSVLKQACLAPKVGLELDDWQGKLYWAGREIELTALFVRLTEALSCVGFMPQGLFETYLAPILKGRSFNPIKRYLESLADSSEPWEGWDTLARDVFHLDDQLSQEMLTKWLIGAVKRGMEPGCHMRQALVLKGEQEVGKSEAVRILGGAYYASRNSEMNDTDVSRLLAKSWVCELEEMEAIVNSKSLEALKRFVSVKEDDFRALYCENIDRHDRHCVFIGTVNTSTFLKDTSNKRFWVLDCGGVPINNDYLKANRDRIFAEAYRRYTENEATWTPELSKAAEERAAAYTPDNEFSASLDLRLSELVKQYGPDLAFKLEDLILSALQIKICDQAKHTKKVSAALVGLAVKKAIKRDNKTANYYVPVASQAAPKDLKILRYEPSPSDPNRAGWKTV